MRIFPFSSLGKRQYCKSGKGKGDRHGISALEKDTKGDRSGEGGRASTGASGKERYPCHAAFFTVFLPVALIVLVLGGLCLLLFTVL